MPDTRDLFGYATVAVLVVLSIVLGLRVWDVVARGPSETPTADVLAETAEEAPAAPVPTETNATAASTAPLPDSARGRGAMEAAVVRADAAARAAVPGTYELAVLLPDTQEPIFRGERRYRMWSTSKALVAATLLRLRVEAGEPAVDEALYPWLTAALSGSENCAARHVTYELQQRAGGPGQAYAAIRETAALSGIALSPNRPKAASADAICDQFIPSAEERAARVLQMGTLEWTTLDAARFMAGLSDGQFGDGVGEAVLGLLREPKRHSRELPGELTGSPTWGAGQVFANPAWEAAYKAGWGGSARGSFVAEQMILVTDRHGGTVAIAGAFWPATAPRTDDPAAARVPEAFDALLDEVRRTLTR